MKKLIFLFLLIGCAKPTTRCVHDFNSFAYDGNGETAYITCGKCKDIVMLNYADLNSINNVVEMTKKELKK
jgi:hypothetical protein